MVCIPIWKLENRKIKYIVLDLLLAFSEVFFAKEESDAKDFFTKARKYMIKKKFFDLNIMIDRNILTAQLSRSCF